MRYLLVLCLAGCGGIVIPPPDPGRAECEEVCEHLHELDCDTALGSAGPDFVWGTEDDYSCEWICRDGTDGAQRACMAQAATCDQAEVDC